MYMLFAFLQYNTFVMMISPNTRARKEGKERGKVKGEYGRKKLCGDWAREVS